jgi:hypothetical protein
MPQGNKDQQRTPTEWIERGGYQPPPSAEGPKNPPKHPSPIQTAPPKPKGGG